MTGQWHCERADALLIPSGPRAGQMHLFALMLDPVKIDGHGPQPQVLLACVVSKKESLTSFEDLCVIAPGEHPFIKHESYVDYRHTRLESAEHIQKCVEQGTFVAKEPCSPELLQRIIEGALKSKRISREYKLLLQKVLNR